MNNDALLPEVLPHVPGCSDPLAETAIRNSVIEFCQQSHAWQENLAPIVPEADVKEYDLNLPTGAALVLVLDETEMEVDLAKKTVIFAEVPAGSITLRVALKPARAADSFPDHIGEQYGEAIVSGALAKLMMMTGKPWANPQLAEYHGRIVSDAISRARAREFRGYTNRSMRIDAVRFI